MEKQNIKTHYKYLLTALAAAVIFVFSMLMRNTELYRSVYLGFQLFSELPFFSACVAIPFLLFGIIRLFAFPKKEARYFYLALILTFAGGIIYELITKPETFRIFDIIAISVGLFLDMVLYEVYNNQLHGKILNGNNRVDSTIQKKI